MSGPLCTRIFFHLSLDTWHGWKKVKRILVFFRCVTNVGTLTIVRPSGWSPVQFPSLSLPPLFSIMYTRLACGAYVRNPRMSRCCRCCRCCRLYSLRGVKARDRTVKLGTVKYLTPQSDLSSELIAPRTRGVTGNERKGGRARTRASRRAGSLATSFRVKAVIGLKLRIENLSYTQTWAKLAKRFGRALNIGTTFVSLSLELFASARQLGQFTLLGCAATVSFISKSRTLDEWKGIEEMGAPRLLVYRADSPRTCPLLPARHAAGQWHCGYAVVDSSSFSAHGPKRSVDTRAERRKDYIGTISRYICYIGNKQHWLEQYQKLMNLFHPVGW